MSLDEALLAKIYRNDADLTEINLTGERIGDEEIQTLSQALIKNTQVERIKLRENYIGNRGAKFLAELLRANTQIAYIDLRNNQIEDVGAIALAEGLRHNTHLACLCLEKNKIRSAGQEGMVDPLKENLSLTVLSGNGHPWLKPILVRNRQYKTLYRHFQEGDVNAWRELRKKFSDCPEVLDLKQPTLLQQTLFQLAHFFINGDLKVKPNLSKLFNLPDEMFEALNVQIQKQSHMEGFIPPMFSFFQNLRGFYFSKDSQTQLLLEMSKQFSSLKTWQRQMILTFVEDKKEFNDEEKRLALVEALTLADRPRSQPLFGGRAWCFFRPLSPVCDTSVASPTSPIPSPRPMIVRQ